MPYSVAQFLHVTGVVRECEPRAIEQRMSYRVARKSRWRGLERGHSRLVRSHFDRDIDRGCWQRVRQVPAPETGDGE